jgi:hypothetical protein
MEGEEWYAFCRCDILTYCFGVTFLWVAVWDGDHLGWMPAGPIQQPGGCDCWL